jgi:hypothetical protein
MWSGAEHPLELPDEVRGRDPHVARKRFDGRLWAVELRQQLACSAEAAKAVVSQQHGANPRRRSSIALRALVDSRSVRDVIHFSEQRGWLPELVHVVMPLMPNVYRTT